ncbi:MAG: PKD domain-containing protein [Bacteroidota bacterium]
MRILFPYLKSTVVFLWITLSTTNLFSQRTSSSATSNTSWKAIPFERKAFIENKGQFAAILPSLKSDFSYCIDNGSKVFFYNQEVIFYYTKSLLSKEDREEKDDPEEERERERKMQLYKPETQFISLKWLNANPNATIEVSDEQTTDYGYVISKNAVKPYTAHCKGYSKLKIINLYNGIDAEYFFTEKEGFKYNLYVSPGADINQIQQQYNGSKSIELVDGNIIIKTIQGDIIDHAPISYNTLNKEQKIASSFILKKNTVSFKLENINQQSITIDPWVTPPTMTMNPGDNGVDKYGNSYITNGAYILEKYSPTGALILSTDVMGGTAPYYGDMLTDSRGYCFFNTVGLGSPRGDASAVDSAGNFLWDSFGITECWRFVLNECNQQVLSLTGYRHSETGFAKINTETGALIGYNQSGSCCQDPHCGAIDYNGDVYCVASDGSNSLIYKWTPANTIAATYPAVGSWGYGTGYVADGGFSQGYNGMTILGNNLYIYDGATLFKVNKTNGTIVKQVTVPGGVNQKNGGLYITSCGKVFVGSGTGVYMYDINFNQIDFKSTTGKVLDLAFNTFNQTISACGLGHVTELAFVIPPCIFQTQPFIQPSCGGFPNGYIKLNLNGGVPDYTYTWTNNGITLSQITDSIGNLAPGTYKCVFSDNKCPIPNIDSINIVVSSVTATAAFTFTNVCQPLAVPLTDSSYVTSGSISSWKWKFGDGDTSIQQNPSHVYLNDGTFNVTLTVTSSNGCIDSVIKNVIMYPKPNAGFTSVNKCDGTAVPLNSNSSINNPDVITNWNWSFGDNTAGIGSSNTHAYAAPGNYNVRLIVTSNHLCSDTSTSQITVFNNPVAAFSHSNVCLGDSMSFTNNSSVNSPDSIATYLWNFDDGSSSNLKTPVHKYAAPGTYNVTLVTTTANGCTDAQTSPVKTFDAPTTLFSFNNTCLFAAAAFTNTSLNPTMGTIADWSWNFGDGTPLNTTVNSPNHLYNLAGSYEITLITRSTNLGCADTLKDSITVFPMPIADFGFADVCFSETMNFYDSSEVTSGNISGWSWDFGDLSPLATVQNPTHTYTNPGSYNVTLIAATNNGCKDTITKNVIIHPLPVASFTTTNVCLGSTSAFNNQSIISTNPTNDVIQSWIWNFGDGSPVITSQNSTHLYTAIGTYSVQLLVISSFGCKDSISKPDIVNPNPVPAFTADDTVGCEPVCVNFQNQSTIATGTNTNYSWDLGNGSSTNQNPNTCYNNNAVYSTLAFNITLQVTSDSGCTATLTKTNYIKVFPNPEPGFSVQPATVSIINPVISITDLSVGANFWKWNFGDSDTSSISSPPPHTYADTGTYTITQIVSTLNNCIDTAYQTVTIEPEFLFYVPNSFTPNNDGQNDAFTGKGVFIIEFEMMIFDRWGNLIFFSEDINKPWNGTADYGSEIAQQDVYVYTIKVTDIKRKKHSYRGIVTLVR